MVVSFFSDVGRVSGSGSIPVCRSARVARVLAQALEERRQVQQFLDAAQALVSQQPESVEAIGRARADAKRLVGQLPDVLVLRCGHHALGWSSSSVCT